MPYGLQRPPTNPVGCPTERVRISRQEAVRQTQFSAENIIGTPDKRADFRLNPSRDVISFQEMFGGPAIPKLLFQQHQPGLVGIGLVAFRVARQRLSK